MATTENITLEATASKETTKKEITKMEKMVKIRLPITKDMKDDVFVSVNDRTWLIQRGREIEVPECVAEVLRNQELQLEQAMLFHDTAKND